MEQQRIGYLTILILIFAFSGCKNPEPKVINWEASASYIHELNNQLSEAIIQDGLTPPVAARSYAYPNIAAYEALQVANDDYRSLGNQLNGLPPLPNPPSEPIDVRVSMVKAFCRVGVEVVYRDHILDTVEKKLLNDLKMEVDEQVFIRSEKFGDEIANAIKSWAASDLYKETRTMPRFQPSSEPGKWVPTPPSYGEAIEPHWMKLRPMVMDSAQQFSLFPNEPYSEDKTSEFRKLVIYVYDAVNNLSDEQRTIAKFWDCNPQVTVSNAHLMGLKRQLTPGGHWMGIARTASKTAGADIFEATEAYTRVSIGLYEVFISVWDEKYKTDLIRPETYINRFIDPDWRPFLETPMFPEHTSGHSAVSRTSATILTNLFGDNFSFTDSVNVPFNNPARSFDSFLQASDEAAMSRVYGGIHYEPARVMGIEQGQKVAELIIERVTTKK